MRGSETFSVVHVVFWTRSGCQERTKKHDLSTTCSLRDHVSFLQAEDEEDQP